jgi:flagellar hook-associated protein 1 FlgK
MAASQAALQVAGNNMANAATPGFNRRTVALASAGDDLVGRNARVGRGVQLLDVRRQVDVALQARLRNAGSHQAGTLIDQRFLTAIETIQNELSDNDLSTLLSAFFNSFSELANNPEDNSIRAVVIEQGATIADRIKGMREDYGRVTAEIDSSLSASVTHVNDILDRIERINLQVAQSEAGGGEASALRDQRDALLDELSTYLEISVVEQPSGVLDVLVGSTPIVLNGESRGVELRVEQHQQSTEVSIRVADDGTRLSIDSGQLGALLRQREQTVQPAIDALDQFAEQLIFQVNRLHSQGQGKRGFTGVTGSYATADATAAMNSDAADLPFDIVNGAFFIHVTHSSSGVRTAHRVDVDGDTMSLSDLVDAINAPGAVPNVTAAISGNGQLTLSAEPGFEISFSDDTSGTLAALGINTFFTGQDATDMGLNEVIASDPTMLAAGAGNIPGSNDTALAIAALQDESIESLGARSLRSFWQEAVGSLAVRAAAANDAVESAAIVRDNLHAQLQAVSGVSLDEESINLITFQRQFQAAARFIAVIDETLQTLLAMA